MGNLFRTNGLRVKGSEAISIIRCIPIEQEAAIQQGNLVAFKNDFLSRYHVNDEEVRLAQKRKWLSTLKHGDKAGLD